MLQQPPLPHRFLSFLHIPAWCAGPKLWLIIKHADSCKTTVSCFCTSPVFVYSPRGCAATIFRWRVLRCALRLVVLPFLLCTILLHSRQMGLQGSRGFPPSPGIRPKYFHTVDLQLGLGMRSMLAANPAVWITNNSYNGAISRFWPHWLAVGCLPSSSPPARGVA